MPHALADFGVHGAEGLSKMFHFRPLGSVFIGTGKYLSYQLGFGGIGCDVLFGNKAKRAYHCKGIMLHSHGWKHGMEGTFVEQVH